MLAGYGRCPMCGEIFERGKNGDQQVYCSPKCRQAAYRERHAGKLHTGRGGRRVRARQLPLFEGES